MFRSTMLFTILAFLFILSVLVLVHETGHFLSAKYFGVKVDEFGIGFPPRAKKIFTSKDGVEWTINWLPLGGFVKLKGENGAQMNDPDSFGHKPGWQRILILSAGVIMNVLLAFVLLVIGYSVGWPQDITDSRPEGATISQEQIVLVYVEKSSPADVAGMKAGDIIKTIDKLPVQKIDQLQKYIEKNPDKSIHIAYDQNGVLKEKTIAPQEVEFHLGEEGSEKISKYGIGVALGQIGVIRFPVHKALWLGAKNTVLYTGKIMEAFYRLFRDLIMSRKVSPQIGGPVMIASLSGKVARMGIFYLIQFLALLSLNLAIINILPIPALDGGRIMFVVIEKIKGRAVSMQAEAWTHVIGFWLLIALTVVITARDIVRLDVWEKIKNIIAS